MRKQITIVYKVLLGMALFCFLVKQAVAQETLLKVKTDSVTENRLLALEKKVALHKPGISRLVVVGLTTFGYASERQVNTTSGVSQTGKSGAFGNADTYEFSPMFLWRHSKKILLEFEPSFNNDGLSVNWANISYFAAPNIILRGGYFVLPFGIYTKKLAAGWINKMATDPIGIPTGSDYGVGASGGVQAGTIKWNYDLSITNGMYLLPNGQLQNINLGTNSRGKTFTGRLGLLPLSDNSLEIGVSGMTGDVSNGNTQFQNARSLLYAFDLNYVKNFNPIQVNLKSQYNVVNINNQNYVNPNDSTKEYTFNNHSTSGYGQLSIRPIGLQKKFIKNIELAFRYANYTTPANSAWGSKTNQIDYGINYWINWRTVVRFTYEIINSTNTANQNLISSPDESKTYAYHVQFSIQL